MTLGGLSVYRDPFDEGSLIVADDAEIRRALAFPPTPLISEPFDLAAAILRSSLIRYAPTVAIMHPSMYRRTRRGYAEVEIRDALGGRQRGGKRRKSTSPFRERRTRAMAAVLDLWHREAFGPEPGAAWAVVA